MPRKPKPNIVYYQSDKPTAKVRKRRSRKPVVSEVMDLPGTDLKIQFYTYDVTGLKYKMPKEPKGGWPPRVGPSPQAKIATQESTVKENL